MSYQVELLVRDMLTAALALRVFGPAALAAVRRAMAAGVRAGVSEIRRQEPGEGRR